MRWWLAGLLCVAAGTAARATVVVPADFTQVVEGSALIAYGRVVDVRPEWADERRRIDSVVTVEVFEWYRGGGGETLSFSAPGGTIGRYRQMMVGAPVFEAGDEAFFFLKPQEQGLPVIFGLTQGVFRVHPDGRGQRQVIQPALLLPDGQAAQRIQRGDRARTPVPVGAFRSQLRAVMSTPRAVDR